MAMVIYMHEATLKVYTQKEWVQHYIHCGNQEGFNWLDRHDLPYSGHLINSDVMRYEYRSTQNGNEHKSTLLKITK